MAVSQAFSRNVSGGEDTIVALATAHGRSAIALVRLSGDKATVIAGLHINPWPIDPRESRLCTIHDHERLLDRALVTVYPGPRSFTGEDVVEISTHGGYIVPASVMAALIGSGAREALPGEFTRRAVLNGKLDIIQAEAIGDLIDARSSAMQQTALTQLDGGLSSRIALVRERVLSLESLIAYDVDFPEEDDGPVSRDRIRQGTDDLAGLLDHLMATVPVGEIVREGAIVVIAGEPNAGKSSLFNALLGEQRAIVTEIPGTTRDAIEGLISAGKWPLRLVDTAGLRQSGDIIERLGIETSERYVAHAHLILNCGETVESLERTQSVVTVISNAPVIGVLTKTDLSINSESDKVAKSRSSRDVSVSAWTGEGLACLSTTMEAVLTQTYGDLTADVPLLTRTRHIHAIRRAQTEIQEFKAAWTTKSVPATIAAVHLHSAAVALEDLIGAVSTEDVLERLFSSFCVGK